MRAYNKRIKKRKRVMNEEGDKGKKKQRTILVVTTDCSFFPPKRSQLRATSLAAFSLKFSLAFCCCWIECSLMLCMRQTGWLAGSRHCILLYLRGYIHLHTDILPRIYTYPGRNIRIHILDTHSNSLTCMDIMTVTGLVVTTNM